MNIKNILIGVILVGGSAALNSYADVSCPPSGLTIQCDAKTGCIFTSTGTNEISYSGITWLVDPMPPYPSAGHTTLSFIQASYWETVPNWTGCLYNVNQPKSMGNRITLMPVGTNLAPAQGHWAPTEYAPLGCTDIKTCTFKQS